MVAGPAPLHAVVAACTRRRPMMLRTLLDSCTRLTLPEAVTVTFLVVENDETERTRGVADEVAPALPGPLVYVLETEPGIPQARNRALDTALAQGADVMLFVDDDEDVEPDWLAEMIAAFRADKGALIGGPVRPRRPDAPLTALQETVYRGVEKRLALKEARAKELDAAGEAQRVTVVTNNWLCDLDLCRSHGLRFDDALRYSGGEDTAFYRAAQEAGAKTGWAPDAIVNETSPPDRLTLGYVFRRGRDQSTTHCRAKLARRPIPAALGVLVSVPLKALGCVALAVSLPVTRSYGLVSLVRQAGWIVGRLRALANAPVRFYARTTGY